MKLAELHARQMRESPAYAAAYEEERVRWSLANQILDARLAIGLSQGDLAHKARLTQPQLARIENGDANPTFLTLRRIAIALNVTLRIGEPDAPLTKESAKKVEP